MQHTSTIVEQPKTVFVDESIKDVIWVDPERLSGAACFKGTRVPISNLFEYLEGGESLEDFLDAFEGVTRGQAVKVLD
jgi:uncharacterized protein (DUF433 family)